MGHGLNQLVEAPPEYRSRVIVIGEGLGGITESLYSHLRNRPVIIDPANYGELQEVLEKGEEWIRQEGLIDVEVGMKLQSSLERSRIYSDSEKVHHIPFCLDKAIEMYPELRCSADYVVDN